MGLQRVGHDLTTEQQQREQLITFSLHFLLAGGFEQGAQHL